jgi:hypothetical protein
LVVSVTVMFILTCVTGIAILRAEGYWIYPAHTSWLMRPDVEDMVTEGERMPSSKEAMESRINQQFTPPSNQPAKSQFSSQPLSRKSNSEQRSLTRHDENLPCWWGRWSAKSVSGSGKMAGCLFSPSTAGSGELNWIVLQLGRSDNSRN